MNQCEWSNSLNGGFNIPFNGNDLFFKQNYGNTCDWIFLDHTEKRLIYDAWEHINKIFEWKYDSLGNYTW